MAFVDPLRALLDRYARSGDAAAMEELVRRTRRRLLATARGVCGEHDAEDAVQGAYHALLRRGPLAPGVPVLGWLVTTTVRMAWRRRALARRFVALAEHLAIADEGARSPLRGAERAERDRLVRDAVARLPQRYRDPIVLHHLSGVPVSEVARLMDLPESTVKTRLRRGRALLEGPLTSLLVSSLLWVPWTLVDLARHFAPHEALTVGGVMKLKLTAVVALVACATGLAGYAAGARVHRVPAPRAVAAQSTELRVSPPPPATPEQEPGTTRDTPAEPPEPDAAADADAAWVRRLEEAATARGVSAATLERVRYAIVCGNSLEIARGNGNAWVDHHLVEFQDAVEAMRETGTEGYQAALAVLDTGAVVPCLAELLARCCPPGGEHELVACAGDPAREPFVRAQALDALAAIRTDPVADFVERRAREEEDPTVLLAAAGAAVAHGRPLDMARMREFAEMPAGSRLHRSVFDLLARASDADALVQWARDPAFPSPGSALDALSRSDPERARREAAAILDGPRAPALHAMQRARLRVVAGRW